MADAEYDVVIAGAGTKALNLGVYLAKFGGMKVAMFERRHEAGGGMAGEESPAPGFVHPPHAIGAGGQFYWNTIMRDFPDECKEFDFENASIAHYPLGVVFPEDQTCVVVTNEELDPDQSKTAAHIAQFSKKDADTWLRIVDPYKRKRAMDIFLKLMFNPPSFENPTLELYADPKMQLSPDWMVASFWDQAQELFESREMRAFWLYIVTSMGIDPFERGQGLPPSLYMQWMLENSPFPRGNVHHNAHALIKMNISLGNKIFTNMEVDRIIIENGAAKGIRLVDGTEIRAKQMVVTNVDPGTLANRFIGRENLSETVVRKVDRIQRNYVTCTWYGWALHETPRYYSEKCHPHVGDVCWLGVVSKDYDQKARRRDNARALGYLPKDKNGNTELCLAIGHHPTCPGSTGRGIIAPEGKDYFLTEVFVWAANHPDWNEKRWLAWKKEHAEDTIRVWNTVSPNMTWDNVIGYDPETPWDIAQHMPNMGPEGNWRIIDAPLSQLGPFRPIMEWSQYKVPDIKGLYCTGSGWHPAGWAWSCEGYNAYKVMAQDFGLRKPWEELNAPY